MEPSLRCLLDKELVKVVQIVVDLTVFVSSDSWILPDLQRIHIVDRLDYWRIVQRRIHVLLQTEPAPPFLMQALEVALGRSQEVVDVRDWTNDLNKLVALDRRYLAFCEQRLKAQGADAIAGNRIDDIKYELEQLKIYAKRVHVTKEPELRKEFPKFEVWRRIDKANGLSEQERKAFFDSLPVVGVEDIFTFMGYLFPLADQPASGETVNKWWKMRSRRDRKEPTSVASA
jgi:hypothetical protein